LQISLRRVGPKAAARKDQLTESSGVHLLCRESEDRQHFNHYLNEYFGHRRCGRDLRVDLEASEEVFDTFKKIDQGIIASFDVLGRLSDPDRIRR
jgi:hypothetical protein